MEFSQQPKPDFTTIVLSDPARQRIPTSAPAIDGVHGTITLGQALGNGVYPVAYRVVSVDGHTLQSSYAFTVADPARPAATLVTQASAAPPAASAGVPTGVRIGSAGTAVILAAVAAYLYASGRWRGRGRYRTPSGRR